MRRVSWFMLVALILILVAPKTQAGTTTYDMIFSVVTDQNVSTPPTGYFVYDTAANQFTQFVVNWDTLGPFDISSTVNTQYASLFNPSLPPSCIGVNTAQTNFFMFTVPTCGSGALGWGFGAETNSPSTFQVLLNFDSPINGKFEAGENLLGSVPSGQQDDIAQGTLTVRVRPRTRPPVGGWRGQVIRMIAGPVYVPPGLPVEFTIGFVDVNGNFVGPTSTNILTAGQWATLDLNVDNYVQDLGQRIEVRPVVDAINPSGAAATANPTALSFAAATEVIDRLTGFGQVLVPDNEGSSPNPVFEYQGLAAGQTMRMNVYAAAPNSCSAVLSFADIHGNAIGPRQQVNLSPGTGASLDLNANTLGLGFAQRAEVLPVLTLVASLPGTAPNNSDCRGSVEVFGNLLGKTWTYQTGGN